MKSEGRWARYSVEDLLRTANVSKTKRASTVLEWSSLFSMIYNYIERKFNRLRLDGRAIGLGCSMCYWSRDAVVSSVVRGDVCVGCCNVRGQGSLSHYLAI
jgi:hypothetical protein